MAAPTTVVDPATIQQMAKLDTCGCRGFGARGIAFGPFRGFIRLEPGEVIQLTPVNGRYGNITIKPFWM